MSGPSIQYAPDIQAHISRFELIDNRARWVEVYSEHYVGDRETPERDKMDKDQAIMRATFQALADAQQLRIRRAIAFTGQDGKPICYHEVQILNQEKDVVHIIRGSFDSVYALYADAEEILIRNELQPSCWDPEHVEIYIVLPLTFPNRPEFRDANGLPLQCPYLRYNNSFQSFSLTIDRQFVTDDFETEEMRPVRSRKRCMTRCKTIKEELMIKCWSPARVEELLMAGYDIEDM